MKYMAIILSLIISFLLFMLCIQATTWGDGTSVAILSGGFAFIFTYIANHIKKQKD
jgi:hypothetical protein